MKIGQIMWGINGVFALSACILMKITLDINLTQGLIINIGSWILLNQLTRFGFSEVEE